MPLMTFAFIMSLNTEYVPVWVAIVYGIPGVVASVLGYINNRKVNTIAIKQDVVSAKQDEAKVQLEQHGENVTAKLTTITKNTDGMTDKLMEASTKAGYVQGVSDQKEVDANGSK
jgi:hypothetical protein